MTKDELKNKIQDLVKSIYSGKTNKSTEVDIDNTTIVSLDDERFPVLVKFPTLKLTIIKLLTDQYDLFLKDIEWVAPRPTTFRIVLGNDQTLNLSEEQNCIEAIARILSYGAKPTPEKTEVPAAAPESSAPETAPEDEAPAEETPTT